MFSSLTADDFAMSAVSGSAPKGQKMPEKDPTGALRQLMNNLINQRTNPGFKLKQIQILKNKILDFIIKFEFLDFSLLGEKIGVF